MLFRLEMRSNDGVDANIRAGTVVKWHKREGEAVQYGDDLFDLKVHEVGVPESTLLLGQQLMSISPDALANLAAQQLAEKDVKIGNVQPTAERRVKGSFFVRVSSSDVGVLRRICAKDGELREVGDLLAILTTDSNEPIGGLTHVSSTAAMFRTVSEVLRSDRDVQAVMDGIVENNAARNRYIGPNYLVQWSGASPDRRVGIYLKGSADLNSIFACVPLIQPGLKGRCCIFRSAPMNVRSDSLLQTLLPFPQDWTERTVNTLRLHPDYFRPTAFERTFQVRGLEGSETFPKTVVALSVVPEVISVCYRHKDSGFLCDPDAYWLYAEMDEALNGARRESLAFLEHHFECVRKTGIDEFARNFSGLIRTIQDTTGAQVLVFNAATATRGSATHNYQFLQDPPSRRRIEFNLALVDLSRRLGFSIVDVDRVLKRAGLDNQLDWARRAPGANLAIAQEAFGIMRDLGVFA